MANTEQTVAQHYGTGGIMAAILAGLEESGADMANLSLDDLYPVAEFHTRGLESTVELAALGQFNESHQVLDIGCGMGGTVQYMAKEYGCQTVGLDLTEEYIDVANRLSELLGGNEKVSFVHGSALDLPFMDHSFDRVWTAHAQMNIADKGRFFAEISRVLKPGGTLLLNDVFQGSAGPAHYPTPWAVSEEISFLATQEETQADIQAAGLTVTNWEDKTALTLDWFKSAMAAMKASGPPPVGLHLLMSGDAPARLGNVVRNLEERRITIALGTASKD